MERIRSHQLELIKMLIELKKILYSQNINFFLIGGSVLGSIRHKGFIPWDDDIDIAVYRNDFEKLENILIKTLKNSNMIYYTANNDEKPDPIGRLCLKKEVEKNIVTKVIDIHPIDNVPKSIYGKLLQFIMLKFYYLFLWEKPAQNKGKICKLLTKIILLITPKKLKINLKYSINNYLKRGKVSEEIINLHGIKGYWKEIMPREYIGSPVLKEFEGEMFYIPEKWHEYLTFLYGDYMKLPDEKDRKPRHGLKESEEEK